MHMSLLLRCSVLIVLSSALLDEADDSSDDTGAAENGAANNSDDHEDETHDGLTTIVLSLAHIVVATSGAAFGTSGA